MPRTAASARTLASARTSAAARTLALPRALQGIASTQQWGYMLGQLGSLRSTVKSTYAPPGSPTVVPYFAAVLRSFDPNQGTSVLGTPVTQAAPTVTHVAVATGTSIYPQTTA